MANFERRGLALERSTKRRGTGTRFGDLSDRLTRAFTGSEDPEKTTAWEEPSGTSDYQLRDEREGEAAWNQVVPRFPLARQGYDCAAVEAHIADLEQELTELDRELSELRAHAPAEDQVAEEIQRVGEQTSAILLAAHDKAQETTRQAQEQADRVLADAAANAIAITKDANRKLHELEAEKLTVWRERSRLLEDVSSLSEALSGLAAEAAKRFPAEPKVTPLTPAGAAEATQPEPVKA